MTDITKTFFFEFRLIVGLCKIICMFDIISINRTQPTTVYCTLNSVLNTVRSVVNAVLRGPWTNLVWGLFSLPDTISRRCGVSDSVCKCPTFLLPNSCNSKESSDWASAKSN